MTERIEDTRTRYVIFAVASGVAATAGLAVGTYGTPGFLDEEPTRGRGVEVRLALSTHVIRAVEPEANSHGASHRPRCSRNAVRTCTKITASTRSC